MSGARAMAGHPREMRDDDTDDDTLFRILARTGDRSVRNLLVERHTGLAVHIAQRFPTSRNSADDLRQVALYGLVKAVDRFDPDHGASFAAFAGSTIEGELKRYFRDRTWAVRVPRSGKELHLAVRGASEDWTQRHGRSPTVAELASHMAIDRDDVLRGLAASAAYRTDTLDAPFDDGGTDRQAALAVEDEGFVRSESREMVRDLLERLPERERRIVELRFYEGLSQSEIAKQVGLSQMHVSRLLRQSFERMRALADASPRDPG